MIENPAVVFAEIVVLTFPSVLVAVEPAAFQHQPTFVLPFKFVCPSSPRLNPLLSKEVKPAVSVRSYKKIKKGF